MPQLAGAAIAKAKHSRGDQALLDTAHFACDRCLKFGGLSVDEQANMEQARDYLQKAGAAPAPLWTAGTTEDDDFSPASLECPVGDSPEVDTVKVLAAAGKVLCKRQRVQQNLMDLAHECLETLTDGRVCEKATKLGARHSKETMELFKASHRHLVAAGARCDAAAVNERRAPVQLVSDLRDGPVPRQHDVARADQPPVLFVHQREAVRHAGRLPRPLHQREHLPARVLLRPLP